MKNVKTLLFAVFILASLFSPVFAQAEEDNTMSLLDKIVLEDAVEIPPGVPTGMREIPCNILSESPTELLINFSKNKKIPQKVTLKRADIKEIFKDDGSARLYYEIRSKLGTVDLKLRTAEKLDIPYQSASAAFYNDLLEKDINLIIQKYPNCVYLGEVQALKEKILTELAQIKQGKIRIGDKWLSEGEYATNKINFDCLAFIDKIRSHAAPYPPKLFLQYYEDLDKYKPSSHLPEVIKALQEAATLITSDSIDKTTNIEDLDDQKRKMQDEIGTKQIELATAEDELKKIINQRVEEIDGSWSSNGTAKTTSGKKYSSNDARRPEQDRILMLMSKYLDKRTADDLPFLQLQEKDIVKAQQYFKIIQDKSTEIIQSNRELSQLDRSFEAKQKELQNKIRNASKRISSGAFNRYAIAYGTFDLFKASYKIFQQSPTSDINEINKLLMPLNQSKSSWPENIEMQTISFDVAFFLLDTAKKSIEAKSFKDANAFIQQVDRLATDIKLPPESPLAARYVELRSQITIVKREITSTIQSEQEAKIAADKRLKEITSIIESLSKSKDWGAILDLKPEIETIDTQNRLKTALDNATRNQTQSNNQYNEVLRLAKANKFDMIADTLRQARDIWPKNPKIDEIKKAVSVGYKKTFSNKDYVNALQWLDLASTLKIEEGDLNINEEIDKCNALIAEDKKQKLILYGSITGGVLLVLLVIGIVLRLILSKKAAAAPIPVPEPVPTPHQPSHHPHK